MKKVKQFFLVLMLLFACYANAQTISKLVLASGGEALSNGDIQLNLTLGEPIVGLIANDTSLDQGFWVGSLLVEPIEPEEELGGMIVFPNPVEEQLNIFTNGKRVYGITMFSVDGRMVVKKKVDESQTQHQIDASFLSKGVYVLQVLVEGDSEEKLFKILKK